MRDFDPTASEFISSGYIRDSRPGGQMFDPVSAAVMVGGQIIGGAMSSDAAGDAADTQANASREATAAQRETFDKQVQLQEPWRQAGMSGLNRLGFLMGLSPNGFQGGNPFATGGTAAPGGVETADQIRARLVPQFSSTAGLRTDERGYPVDAYGNLLPTGYSGNVVNEVALMAAVQSEMQRQQQAAQQAAQTAQPQAAPNDPEYGSLLRKFGKSDFETDPGYQFRQSEGEKGMQRAASAVGGVGSGKFLKDAMRFNQGLATDEYGRAFDRYNVNQTNQFNRLASIAGIGQAAANQTGAAAANFGSQIGSNIIGAGNALAAGRVGGANAINGAIGQGTSMYMQGQLMNRLFPAAPSYGGAGITGGGGFGTGSAFGNQDYGQYF